MDTDEGTPATPSLPAGAARQAAMEWTSDAIAEMISRIGIKYLALVPGASFRGLHDSIVNYLGNQSPELIVCLHEGYAVSIADGYGRATDQPMAVALHSNVGLMHGSMAIYNAWCARVPMLVIGATDPVDAHKRRPWIDWIHTSKDQAAIVRPYIKWDDQPASAEACIEALLRANQIARTAPAGPVYICLDAHLQEQKLERSVVIPPVERFLPAPMPAADSDTVAAVIAAIGKAKLPLLRRRDHHPAQRVLLSDRASAAPGDAVRRQGHAAGNRAAQASRSHHLAGLA
jgi:thiamine pyrophosphate-dependent acetolactate synthase large subunit-like protein